MPANRFIPPAIPTVRTEPPAGSGWLHELKFDGWRVQLHKTRDTSVIYSRNGNDITDRCHSLAKAVDSFLVDSFILDGELIAIGPDGLPQFDLIGKSRSLHQVWAFDLLAIEGQDMRPLAWTDRRRRLESLMASAPDCLRLSETFEDPIKLLSAAEDLGLEGVVSKRLTSAYRSGDRSGWTKVKTISWREVNRDRRWRKVRTSKES